VHNLLLMIIMARCTLVGPTLNHLSAAQLQEQGFPWIVRKTAVKFGSSGATDIVWQSEDGGTMKVVSVNAKGSWQRKLVVGKVTSQRNADGAMCNTTCWWDGAYTVPLTCTVTIEA